MAIDPLASLSAALAGRYDVQHQIGSGGMATVYLARDRRHERNVALKLLNPELGVVLGVDRFLSEIRVTANLQHPNLLPLFDSGEIDGQLFYVMPYVEGESLRARLDREKQLPVEEAVRIALAIAGALDYAHARDVIHRDLKPENILLQHGEPVIADFGIALAVSRAGGSRVTQTGLSLGTPQYMSPERATGDRAIDGRSDIYSLGAVLYEMIGGEAPHTGSTGQAIIAKLMTEEPRRLEALRRAVPLHIADTVHRALEKLPADRWRSPREFAEALRGARTAELSGTRARSSRTRNRVLQGVAALAILVSIAEGIALSRRTAAPSAGTLRFQFVTADSERFVPTTPAIPFSISADDRRVVYTGLAPSGRRLYIRRLDNMQTRALPNTDGSPLQPTFSPDGKWVAFVLDGRLLKTATDGGERLTILPLEGRANAGMSWVDPDTIVAAVGGALMAVPVNGGTPAPLSRADTSRGEILQWGPRVVSPRFVVYIVVGAAGVAGNRLGVLDRRTGRTTILERPGTTVLGSIDDRVLWVTPGGSVMAAKIDGDGNLGASQLVLEDVLVRPGGAAKATLSARGSLLYHRGIAHARLVIVDVHGTATPVGTEPRAYSHPRWSPDGRQIAVTIARTGGGTDVWIVDVETRALRQLTPPDGSADQPEWSADGRRVLYRHRRAAGTTIRWMPADGSAAPEILVDSMIDPYSARTSPDGKWTAFAAIGPVENGGDIAFAPVAEPRKGRFVANAAGHDYTPSFSPDNRWLVYASAQSGRTEVYVRPFPGPGPSIAISNGLGHEPTWSRDGQTIFYREGRNAIAAKLSFSAAGAPPTVLGRTQLFTGDFLMDQGYANWDPSPDGRRFLVLQNVDRVEETVMIYNWADELRRTWR